MSDQLPNPARADALNESQGQAVQQGAATVTAPAAQGALMMGGPHGNATPLAPLPPPGYNITSPQQFAGPSVPNGGYMFLNNLAMGNAHQQMHQLQQMQMMHQLQQTQQAQQPVQQAQTSQWVGMAGLAPSHGVPASLGPVSMPLPLAQLPYNNGLPPFLPKVNQGAKRGRPPGAKNKPKGKGKAKARKRVQDEAEDDEDEEEEEDGEWTPQRPPKRYRTSPSLSPKRTSDGTVPSDDESSCENCSLYKGMYIMQPCGHYAVCHDCVSKEKDSAALTSRDEACLLCKKPVKQYIRADRVSFRSALEE